MTFLGRRKRRKKNNEIQAARQLLRPELRASSSFLFVLSIQFFFPLSTLPHSIWQADGFSCITTHWCLVTPAAWSTLVSSPLLSSWTLHPPSASRLQLDDFNINIWVPSKRSRSSSFLCQSRLKWRERNHRCLTCQKSFPPNCQTIPQLLNSAKSFFRYVYLS